MKITTIMIAAVTLCTVSCDQSQLRHEPPVMLKTDTEVDREVRRIAGKESGHEERERQIPAIVAAFSKRTNLHRARYLGMLCYLKTRGTPFSPLDMAEIALTETGSHGLSAAAESERGALGVWQVMPERAKSHGFEPADMKNDEKCAEAAVRELFTKMKIARGNLKRAKKLYCGVGPQADAYEVKRMRFRREILKEMTRYRSLWAESGTCGLLCPS